MREELLVLEGAAFQVNNGDQSIEPVTAALSGGGYVVAWRYTGDLTVHAQIFDASGVEVGGEIIVTDEDTYAPFNVSVTGLSNGSFVVDWSHTNDVTLKSEVVAQIYSAAGVPAGAQFVVSTATTSEQMAGESFALPGGGFVVTWRDTGASLSTDDSIRAQIFNSAGAKIGGEITVVDTPDIEQASPTGTALADGNFIVAWNDLNSAISQSQFRGQVLDATGSPVGSAFAIAGPNAGGLDIAALPGGGFVGAWNEGDDIRAQIFDNAGQAAGSEIVTTYPPEVG